MNIYNAPPPTQATKRTYKGPWKLPFHLELLTLEYLGTPWMNWRGPIRPLKTSLHLELFTLEYLGTRDTLKELVRTYQAPENSTPPWIINPWISRDTLNELERTYKAPETVVSEKVKADIFNSAHYSTG